MDELGTAMRVLERVMCTELDRFPAVLLASLAEVIPVHHLGYYEVDPLVPRVVFATHPDDFEVNPQSLERGTLRHAEHPIAIHHRSTGDGAAVRISDLMSQQQFHALAYYAEVSAPVGAEYEMAFTLPAPEPLHVVVVLLRTDRDFTDDERDLCNLLRSPLAAAHSQAARTDLLHRALEQQVAAHPGAALIACDGDRLIALHDRAEPLVRRLLGSGSLLHAELRAWLDRARSGDVSLEDPIPDRHGTTWCTDFGSLEIRHIPSLHGRDLLVVREVQPDAHLVLIALGMSPREAEVFEMVVAGLDNRSISARLGIAESTVRKHLEAIYRTLGVSNRTAAAAVGFEALRNATPTPL